MANGARAKVYAWRAASRPGAEAAEVRVLDSVEAVASLVRARRRALEAGGIGAGEAALDAQRAFATNLGLFIDGQLIGGISAWRLSEALCSLGYLLGGVGVERHAPERVVELGGLFLVPEHRGRGHGGRLLAAARILLAGMQPRLAIAFGTRETVHLYVSRCGFHPVGPFVRHPLNPAVEVAPLVATADDLRAANFA